MSSPYGLELIDSCLGCKLRSRKYFCFLPRSSLSSLEKISFASLLPKGSALFVAGQKPSGVYILCTGKVKLSAPGSNRHTVIVKIAGAGELLGLHGCITGTAHEFTAETVQPSQVVFVRRDDFFQFLQQDDHACLKAAQMLGGHCREAHGMLRAFGLGQPASERLARLLLEIAAAAETNNHRAAAVDLGLTHKEIAQAIGMSRETVWRQLCELREQGIATLDGSMLRIQDKPALRRLAGQ